ncbi:MAG: hypothetical protein ACRBCJ_06110 [Hyphomicrobiaceae bacterium]
MSSKYSMLPLAAATMTVFVSVATIFISTDPIYAAEPRGTKAQSCPACDAVKKWAANPQLAELTPSPNTPPNQPALDKRDRIAALESVQYALSEVGDGSSYVWHRGHGKLSGIVRPTASFKDSDGKVCRHVVVMLTSGTTSKKTEAIACRLKSGIWQLDG